MICLVCETAIKSNEPIYWEINEEPEENCPLHSDCLIRWLEFAGDHKQAEEINALDLTEGINRGHKPIL